MSWSASPPLALAVPPWLLDLLGVDVERLGEGTRHFRFARFPEGGLGLLAVLAILGGFALILWLYRHEGQLAQWKKLFLAGLRSTVLLIAALVLFYPVLEVDRKQEVRATTIVLLDKSLSQSVRDVYRGDTARRDATAKTLELTPEAVVESSRAELVARALESDKLRILDRLAERNRLAAYAFGAPPIEPLLVQESAVSAGSSGEPPASPPSGISTTNLASGDEIRRIVTAEPRDPITDIAGAVLQAVEEQAGSRIAGLVLISDGRVTAGDDLKGVASILSDRNVAVHAVGVGDPTPTRNFRVTALLAPERVFTGDPVVIDVRVDQHGFDGETVSVELYDVYEPDDGSEQAPVKIGALDVAFAGERMEGTANFRFEPEGIGRHRLVARIEPNSEETFVDDNERSVGTEVVKEASRVLLISGGPSYEYRFLKNLLRRDSRISLAAWLMSADPDYPQEGNTSLKKIPDTAKDLFEYDVVILMDLDPRGLPAGFAELLERFVAKHRGGLLYVAGDKYSASFFSDRGMAPIRNMLPVIVDPTIVRDELERGKFYDREWPLEPTAAALDHAATRLSSQPDRNRERWAEIAGVYWTFPVKKPKPGATVLFVHPDPALAVDGEAPPVVATQFYEGGRVAWCGVDSTWRWRATAEEVYDAFWIQMVRFLTEGRLMGDRRQIIQTDRESYELGETVRISLLLEDENYRPVEAEQTEVSLESPDGTVDDLMLTRDPNSPGWFRGTFTPRMLKAHKLRSGSGTESVFVVEPPAIEFAEPRLDEDALREIASVTGGTYRSIADVGTLPDAIPDRRQTVVTTDEPIPLWDNWLTVALLAGLLTVEWVLRKLNRLL